MTKNNMNQGRKLNPRKVGAFAAFVIVFFILLIAKGSKAPKLTLKGDSTIDLTLNSTYYEEGATAKYGRKDISKDIQISNNIDNKKIGKYYVTYTVKYKNKKSTITRTVNVVDTTAPILTLHGDESINIAQDSVYKEFGCFATDNYEGDVSSKITISSDVDTSKIGNYTVTYTATDSSGNTASITRIVNVVKKGSGNITNDRNVGVPVLMYHNFYDKEKGETAKNDNYVEIHDFEEQLKYLTDNNYYFPTWDEVKSFVEGKTCLPEHSIVVTVDDGDESFFNLAVPVIQKYDVKVTAFVITSKIESKDYLNNFDKNKIIFESHSHDMHKTGANGTGTFLTLAHDEALSDVKTSKEFLGNATVFCYPFGDHSEACEKILQEAGYDLAFTKAYLRVRPGDDPYALGRIRMTKGDSLQTFIQRVS